MVAWYQNVALLVGIFPLTMSDEDIESHIFGGECEYATCVLAWGKRSISRGDCVIVRVKGYIGVGS